MQWLLLSRNIFENSFPEMDLRRFEKYFLDDPAFEVAHGTVVAQRYASIALTVWRPLGIVTSPFLGLVLCAEMVSNIEAIQEIFFKST